MKPVEVSIIICTYNRAQYLAKALEHIANLDKEFKDFEIVIVNNNSTDNTDSLVLQFVKNHPELAINYVIEDNQGLSFARNRGVAESRGSIISFVDDDAYVDHDFALNLKKFFNKNPSMRAIGGRITPDYEIEKPRWMSRFLLPLVAGLDMGSQVKIFPPSKFPIGANMAFKQEIFEQYGLFDTDLGRKGYLLEGGEEKDLFQRIRSNGEEIFYVPALHVLHHIPADRTKIAYIKAQAKGVAVSERRRVGKAGSAAIISKVFEEAFKIGATALLSIFYVFTIRFSKALMLIRFRAWVVFGYFQKSPQISK